MSSPVPVLGIWTKAGGLTVKGIPYFRTLHIVVLHGRFKLHVFKDALRLSKLRSTSLLDTRAGDDDVGFSADNRLFNVS